MRNEDEVVKDVLINDKDCYNELWEHMQSLVYSIAYRYARKNRVEYDDVKQNSYISWYNLTRTFKTKKMNGNNVKANYISYINKYLPKRLIDYAKDYSLFNDFRVMSLSAYDHYEFLSDEFVLEEGNTKDLRATVDVIVDSFTDRRKEIFELMSQGYNKTDIGRLLDINRSTVYHHYNIIMEKFDENLN